MKQCKPCGIEYPDDMNFCSKCGTKLEAVKPVDPKCPSCGADVSPDAAFCSKCGAKLSGSKTCARCGTELSPDAAFCSKCGAKLSGSKTCARCGTEISPDARFCENCGAPVGATTRSERTDGMYSPSRRATKRNVVGPFIDKAVSFERSRHFVTDTLVIALALAVILVALLCPIKIAVNGLGNSISEDSEFTSEITVSQSIWQIMGAVGYLDLDVNDADDKAKIREIYNEYAAAGKEAYTEFQKWYKNNQDATEAEMIDKMVALTVKYLGDCNILAYQLAYTTLGALDMIMGSDVESSMNDLLVTMRSEAVLSLIFALIAAVVQIAIAVTSLAFMISAIIGLVRAKPVKLFAYLHSTLIVAGIGLAALSCGPTLAPLGAMLAIALTVAVVSFVCGLTRAIFMRKKVAYIIKRAVCAALALTAFFLLCAPVIGVDIVASTSALGASEKNSMNLMLGGSMGALIVCVCLGTLGNTHITYSVASTVGSIATFAVGVFALVLLLCVLWRSLESLARDVESKRRIDVLALTGAIMLLLFVIVPPSIGAAGKAATNGSVATNVGMHMAFYARAYVYVALAFTIALFVFGIAFDPDKIGTHGGAFRSYFTATEAPVQSASYAPVGVTETPFARNGQNELADASVSPSDI